METFEGQPCYPSLKALPEPVGGALIVMLVIGATPGDRRNWEAIRAWAPGLAGSAQVSLS